MREGRRPTGSRIVRAAASLVPWWRRDEWVAEWEGELAWAETVAPRGVVARMKLRLRALAAIRDGLWLRHRHGRQGVMRQDVGESLRSLRKRPGFTATVVLTLALGIGGATTVFSMVDALLLRSLPYPEHERLAEVWRRSPDGFGLPDLDADALALWRDQRGLFERIEVFTQRGAVLTGLGEPTVVGVVHATPGLFELLGLPPVRGRTFERAESTSGERVALVSEQFWRTRMGAEAGSVGATLFLDDEPYTVVGVLPRSFRYPRASVEIYLPLDDRDIRGARGLALLPPGVAVETVTEHATQLAARFAKEQPRARGWGLFVFPLDRGNRLDERARTALFLLGVAVLAVLLIGCANAANLLLVHAASRNRELAVRAALGATRGRIVRLLLTECILLGAFAATLGVVIAWAATQGLSAILPTSQAVFGPNEMRLDMRVLGFAVGLAVATSLLFGTAPALVASRSRVGLTGAERASTGSRGIRRAHAVLAIAELALAMTLLVSAGLLLRSFRAMVAEDPGFDAEGLLLTNLWLPSYRYTDAASRRAFFETAAERLRGLPGVRDVSLASEAPPSAGFSFGLKLQAEGRDAEETGQPELMPVADVDARYFDVLGIEIVQGRPFGPEDAGGPPVAIVDENLARWLWPQGVAVGQRFRLDDDGEWLTVVGVARDVLMFGVAGMRSSNSMCASGKCEYEVYRPLAQTRHSGQHTIVMRVDGDMRATLSAARAALRELDASLPLQAFEPMRQRFVGTLDEPRFLLRLITTFSIVALLLATIGVYAVLAWSVARRTREFGVRIALGARSRDLLRHVLARGAVFASAGVALGLVGASAVSRLLRGLLYGVGPADPAALIAAVVLLGGVALVATVVPARRATRVSPLEALRMD